jgi:ParB-like chromosome segregation protein Spo0J
MRTATKSKRPLFQEGEVAALDPKLERLMQICGMQELPAVHTMVVPLERIFIPNEDQVRPRASFVRNISLVGIRQPPSITFVNGTAWDAEDAQYEVIMGRRRLKSARLLLAKGDARFKTIKCEVYEHNLPRLNAFLGLIENDQRSESWIQDVMSLRLLIREGIAMTLDDLKAYGFNARTIRGRLDIALLPDAILDQICAGAVGQDVALQITRLSEAERERLDALSREGEELTDDLVKKLLRRQVNLGLVPVHTNLSEVWTTLAHESHIPSTVLSSSRGMPGVVLDGPSSVSQVLSILRQFEPQTQTNAALHRAGALIEVLIKELEIAERHLTPRQEGEPSHV